MRAGDADLWLDLTREGGRDGLDEPLGEGGLRTPQRAETVDADLEQTERHGAWVGTPGEARARASECLEHGLRRSPIRLRVGVDEGRLRDESMCAPERHPAPDAERPCAPIGVDDRPRAPGATAQYERAWDRGGLGASGQSQVEWQVRQEQ